MFGGSAALVCTYGSTLGSAGSPRDGEGAHSFGCPSHNNDIFNNTPGMCWRNWCLVECACIFRFPLVDDFFSSLLALVGWLGDGRLSRS